MYVRETIRIVTAHLAMVAVVTVSVAVLAILAVSQRGDEYVAQARLLLRPFDTAEQISDQAGFSPIDFDRYVSNEVALVESLTVAARAAESLDLDPVAVDRATRAVRSAQSEVVVVEAQAPDPATAVALANAVANAYLEDRTQASVAVTERKVAEIGSQLDELEAEITDLQGSIARLPEGSPRIDAIEVGIAAREALYTDLLASQRQLEAERGLKRGSAELVEEAFEASPVGGIGVPTALVGGVVVGLVFGVSLAMLLEAIDRRVRTAEDLEELAGSAALVVELPYERMLDRNRDAVPMLTKPDGAFAAGIRRLRARLSTIGADPKAILVASPEIGEGSTSVAVNLAVAYARSGTSTVLVGEVDGPVRRLVPEEPVGEPGELVPTGVRLLQLAAIHGADRGQPDWQSGLIRSLRSSGYAVVVDSPGALEAAEPSEVAHLVDAVVVVAAAGQTRQQVLEDTVTSLATPAQRHLFVLNHPGRHWWAARGDRRDPDATTDDGTGADAESTSEPVGAEAVGAADTRA